MNTNTQTTTSKCPICGKESNANYHPFCSKHCADVDLNRWLSGVYRIETDESPDDLPVEED
ncbi:MAG: DNA gyrase inhibitor YacG [Alphaproteobacteria bacterium]|nr:DNA gyrase inhibitor YacG [Alphaproteobacteria bacterium]